MRKFLLEDQAKSFTFWTNDEQYPIDQSLIVSEVTEKSTHLSPSLKLNKKLVSLNKISKNFKQTQIDEPVEKK